MANRTTTPFVSIIIPCRNEEGYIGSCLRAIVESSYPQRKIQVVVVDGASSDNTLVRVNQFKKSLKHLVVLTNKNKTTPYAVNLGMKEACGDYIFWISAHSILSNDYISKCIQTIQKYQADCVGGLLIAKSEKQSSLVQLAIASSFNSSFGNGNAPFRNLSVNKITSVDAVFGQCFNRKVISRYGLLNEKLTRNQDYEYNQRIIRGGGKILLNPKLINYYSPPESVYKFTRQAFNNGLWTVLSNKYMTFRSNKLRHYMPLMFVGVLLALSVASIWSIVASRTLASLLAGYLVINIVFSFSIARSSKRLGLVLIQPLVFMALHLCYGVGSLYGLLAYAVIVKIK